MRRYRHAHHSRVARSYQPRSIRKVEKKIRRNILLTVVFGAILLYLIFTWGLPTLIGSLTVLNQFKPNKVEKVYVEDTAISPPVLNIPYEATNSATVKISGYSLPKSEVEIYIDDELKTIAKTQDDGSFLSEDVTLSIGTNSIFGKTLNEKNQKSLPSKTIRVFYTNQRPKLELTEPQEGLIIRGGDKKVKVSGKTDVNNTVSINSAMVIINNEGNFSFELPINEGENIINVIVTNQVGNKTQIERKVTYSP